MKWCSGEGGGGGRVTDFNFFFTKNGLEYPPPNNNNNRCAVHIVFMVYTVIYGPSGKEK